MGAKVPGNESKGRYNVKIRTPDGCSFESKGEMEERRLFALHMLLSFDGSKPKSRKRAVRRFAEKVAEFLDAAEEYKGTN